MRQRFSRLNKELVKSGASPQQARQYINALIRAVRDSKSDPDLMTHHALPRRCGWAKYSDRLWNLWRINWAAHIYMHALLVKMFPNNRGLKRALRILAYVRIGSKLDAYEDAIRLFADDHSVSESAAAFGVATRTMQRFRLRKRVKFKGSRPLRRQS
jgi:hypothetical protein